MNWHFLIPGWTALESRLATANHLAEGQARRIIELQAALDASLAAERLAHAEATRALERVADWQAICSGKRPIFDATLVDPRPRPPIPVAAMGARRAGGMRAETVRNMQEWMKTLNQREAATAPEPEGE